MPAAKSKKSAAPKSSGTNGHATNGHIDNGITNYDSAAELSASSKVKRAAIDRANQIMSLASDPTRAAIMATLGGGSVHVTGICEVLGMTQPAISHHLALMKVGGIIEGERSGKQIFYSLTGVGRMLETFRAKLAATDGE